MHETLALTPEMIWVLGILGLTIILFISELVRVDVAAVTIMMIIGLVGLIPGGPVLVPGDRLFSGFASNAVISIIAVIILGKALEKTGLMNKLALMILRWGGSTEQRIVPIISSTVGVISGLMQNVGAAALFMSVIKSISLRTQLPVSRMLMPMAFCAILGGTLTLIGSSPLILLNDLILASNTSLPDNVEPMKTFGMFDVTPIGLALIFSGVVYFTIFGRYVLPARKGSEEQGFSTVEYFRKLYGLKGDIFEVHVQQDSPLKGKTVSEAESLFGHRVAVIGLYQNRDMRISPAHDIIIETGAVLGLLGNREEVQDICKGMELKCFGVLRHFAEVLSSATAGISEVVVPPRSHMIGKSLQDIRMRKTFGTSVLAVNRGGQVIRGNLRDLPLQAGDTLVLHSLWEDLVVMEKNPDFVVISSDFPHEVILHEKLPHAVIISLITLGLVIFSDLRLSVSLMSGAIAMIVAGVLTMDEAYKSVSWQSVFLLASLIPLGLAMESTGTAAWVAIQTINLMGNVPVWVLQGAVAVLATVFTLLMSNVGATILLVPLAVNIAVLAGADPAMFALTVAISTSNSFLIPTHQVNALVMGPGGYKNADFMRAGWIMTMIFLVVSLVVLNIMF
ncbi:SLC13 family permease [Desulfonatronovibrio hydrogenovorans]|uniref:SLC13 family permease n=1 Tax=Desulfonatronovibrio hydrogenovorans TaxID=53245 RepID=UPI00048D6FE7|nr:SLC13 family permease [Desulfonatronovibrio hydrogenovorans]